ncbi:F-box only protein 16 [Gouania willdenowi]|uniref:F-box only protein 16 n=1 Tax=Gouania willdenowi TaxID=441366 RepID=UPI0010560A15|nr:F-box only protein 16 [Gouania willdenowi]
MPQAPRPPPESMKMQTKLSSWTPLNHLVSNNKVFKERRSLLAKWFDRWSDTQRKTVLQDLVQSSSVEQLRFLSLSVSTHLPVQSADFSRVLPRVLSLYIFSFLDPRSLCRCAQVSWSWRNMVELDHLWMPKCLKLGWCISFCPSPFEQSVWKRHYIQTVQEMRLNMMKTASSQGQLTVSADTGFTCRSSTVEGRPASAAEPLNLSSGSGSGSGLKKEFRERQTAAPPPWRNSDKHPKDIIRYNYLNNLDPMEEALRARTRGRSSISTSALGDNHRRRTVSETNYKLRKAKSLMFLSSKCRPSPPPPPPPPSSCLHHSSISSETPNMFLLHLARLNAGLRPPPVRTPVPCLSVEALRASQRSHRSPPSVPLFDLWPRTCHTKGEHHQPMRIRAEGQRVGSALL